MLSYNLFWNMALEFCYRKVSEGLDFLEQMGRIRGRCYLVTYCRSEEVIFIINYERIKIPISVSDM